MALQSSDLPQKSNLGSKNDDCIIVSEKTNEDAEGKMDAADLKCNDCDLVFNDGISAIQHFKSKEHMEKVAATSVKVEIPTSDANLNSQNPGNIPKPLMDVELSTNKSVPGSNENYDKVPNNPGNNQSEQKTDTVNQSVSKNDPRSVLPQTHQNVPNNYQYYPQNNDTRNVQSYGTYQNDQRPNESMSGQRSDQPYDRQQNVPRNDQYYNDPRNGQPYNTHQIDRRTDRMHPSDSLSNPRNDQSHVHQNVPRNDQTYNTYQNERRTDRMHPNESMTDPKNQNVPRNDQYYNAPRNDQSSNIYQKDQRPEPMTYPRNDPPYDKHQNVPRNEQHYNDPRIDQSYNTQQREQSTAYSHPIHPQKSINESRIDNQYDTHQNAPRKEQYNEQQQSRNDQYYGTQRKEEGNTPSHMYSNKPNHNESYDRHYDERRNSETYNRFPDRNNEPRNDGSYRYPEPSYDKRTKEVEEYRIGKLKEVEDYRVTGYKASSVGTDYPVTGYKPPPVRSPKRDESLALKSFYGNAYDSFFNPPENEYIGGGGNKKFDEPYDYPSNDYAARTGQSRRGYERDDRISHSLHDGHQREPTGFFDSPSGDIRKKKESLALKSFYGDSLDSYFNPPEEEYCGMIPDKSAPEQLDNDKNNFYNNSPRGNTSRYDQEEYEKEPEGFVISSAEDFLNDPPDNLMLLKELEEAREASDDKDKDEELDASRNTEQEEEGPPKYPDEDMKSIEEKYGYQDDYNQNYSKGRLEDNRYSRNYGKPYSKADDNYMDASYSHYKSISCEVENLKRQLSKY